MTQENGNIASGFWHGIVAVFHHVLASILVTLIGAVAFSVGIAKSEHFEDVRNWPIWLALIGAIVALLFSINTARLILRWLSRKRIRASTGNAIALMIASIDGDSDANTLRETIREGIKAELGGRVEIIVWPQVLRLPEGHDGDAEYAARITARKWLKSKQCDLLLWGRVKSDNIVALRITAAEGFNFGANSFALESASINLPTQLISGLGVAIAMRVATATFPRRKTNEFSPITENSIARLGKLANKPHDAFSPLTRAVLLHAYADAEAVMGRQSGSSSNFRKAILAYKSALRKLKKMPDIYLQGAILDGLGSVLADLGEIEINPATLRSAATTFREAIECFDFVGVKEERGCALNHLASALRHLGEREASENSLKESINVFKQASKIFTRSKFPTEWAMVQNNLGNALRALGVRLKDTEFLREAIVVHESVLTEVNRLDQPTTWGLAQNNLGLELMELGARSFDFPILKRARSAFENACLSMQGMAPTEQISVRNNLALANTELGRSSGAPTYLMAAINGFDDLLEDKTLSVPAFERGNILHNRGNAEFLLGQNTNEEEMLRTALATYREALRDRPQQSVPFAWAGTMDNIGAVLTEIAEITGSLKDIDEAIASCRAALAIFETSGASYDAEAAKLNLTAAIELKAIAARTSARRAD